MSTKDELIAKFKTQLTEWEGDLKELQVKADNLADDAKAEYDEQIAALKTRWEEGQAKLAEIADEADDHWDDLKDEAEEKWTALTDGVKGSLDKLKSYLA
jgi:molecular chaperone GrpE (heat shock protein)